MYLPAEEQKDEIFHSLFILEMIATAKTHPNQKRYQNFIYFSHMGHESQITWNNLWYLPWYISWDLD